MTGNVHADSGCASVADDDGVVADPAGISLAHDDTLIPIMSASADTATIFARRITLTPQQ
jgi:hypothetical protein